MSQVSSDRPRQRLDLRSFSKVVEEMSNWVSPPVIDLSEADDFYNDEVRTPMVKGVIPPTYRLPGGTVSHPRAAGGRGNDSSAFSKAALETIERYAMSIRPASDLMVHDSELHMSTPEAWLTPEDFGEPWASRWDRTQPLEWVLGKDLAFGQPIWVPASLVYVPYDQAIGAQLWDPTSNGAAAGFDLDGTITRALCEVIERDAVLPAHHLQAPADEVDLDGTELSAEAYAAVLEARALKLNVRAGTVPSKFESVVAVAVVQDETGGGPAVTAGSAAHSDPTVAISTALLEALIVRRQMRFVGMTPLEALPAAGLSQIVERVAYWAHPDRLNGLNYLFPSWRDASYAQRHTNTPSCALSVEDRAVVVEITPKEIESLGVKVVKVIVPSAQPLYFDESVDHVRASIRTRMQDRETEPHPYG